MDNVKIALQYMMPKHLISRIVGKLASAQAGWLTTLLIKKFIKAYQVNMEEALNPDPESYRTFNDFFTRPLKDGARTINDVDGQLACPVDGAISQLGDIEQGRIFQAKGHDYSLSDLVAGDDELISAFEGGKFATIYLAPKDYHRIHMPCDGKLTKMIYVPGDLFSVNPLTAENVPNLFARNERVIAHFDTEHGPMSMILVGATIVASIETVWAGTVTPPTGSSVFTWEYNNESGQQVFLKKGEEMGRFKLGSTVVMLHPKNKVEFSDYKPKDSTRMGEHYATSQG